MTDLRVHHADPGVHDGAICVITMSRHPHSPVAPPHRRSHRALGSDRTLKGVGRLYQQTVIDTYNKVSFAKLSDRKTPLTAADLLNDRVLPFFDTQGVPLSRILTDRGTECCGAPDRPEYALYLAIEDIEHPRTPTKRPPTNGLGERCHKTVLNECYRVAFRKTIYRTIEALQADLEAWLQEYNERRPHQGRWCYGKTPMQTFLDSVSLAKEQLLAASLGEDLLSVR